MEIKILKTYNYEKFVINEMKKFYNDTYLIPFTLIDILVDYLILIRVKEDYEFMYIIKKYEDENHIGRFPLENL